MSSLQYSELPARVITGARTHMPDEDTLDEIVSNFGHVPSRPDDTNGATEAINGVKFTHHFVSTPGDYESVCWHYVTAGECARTPIIFLHGIPDSWYQWHHQMSHLSPEYFCVAVDLKGYGQSSKQPGNYTHEGASEQLYTMLQHEGFQTFYLVTHDRGTVQGKDLQFPNAFFPAICAKLQCD